MSSNFSIARLPRIEFGAGTINKLPMLVHNYGTHALLITGARSLKDAGVWPGIESSLASAGIGWQSEAVSGEPSPQQVDEIARRYRQQGIQVVVGIGGGSVLDATCVLAPQPLGLLENAGEKFCLSARAYRRIQRVARTIADLAGTEDIELEHVAEALSLRQLDKKRR